MTKINCDVAVIGGGPAGLAAAVAAKKEGAEKVLIIDRDHSLGGILQQCIHPGFGLVYFRQELTGPEYAEKFIDKVLNLGIEFLLKTMVLEVLAEEKLIICASSVNGIIEVSYKSVVLAMGCRERTRANIMIPGTRPSGIYTAGAAQRLINRQNAMIGKRVVILGSGDIGMIMARRMTLEGAKVVAVIEIMNFLTGLTRNRVQCLDDFDIPLKLSHTVTKIVGNERIEGVYIAQVDKKHKPLLNTEKYIKCDTLLLSVGLIPENELTLKAEIKMSDVTKGPIVNQYMQTSLPSVFACGNVVHVNDLVDNVTVESMTAGKYAAYYALGMMPVTVNKIEVVRGSNIKYFCPHEISVSKENEKVRFYFRVLYPDRDVKIVIKSNDRIIGYKKAKIINPGEMENIQINMKEINGNNITVEVLKEAD